MPKRRCWPCCRRRRAGCGRIATPKAARAARDKVLRCAWQRSASGLGGGSPMRASSRSSRARCSSRMAPRCWPSACTGNVRSARISHHRRRPAACARSARQRLFRTSSRRTRPHCWWSTTARSKRAPMSARSLSATRRVSGHVDMVRAWRSPGSTLKPFLYGLALDDGLIHSESLLVDAPQSFGDYRPGNFDTLIQRSRRRGRGAAPVAERAGRGSARPGRSGAFCRAPGKCRTRHEVCRAARSRIYR